MFPSIIVRLCPSVFALFGAFSLFCVPAFALPVSFPTSFDLARRPALLPSGVTLGSLSGGTVLTGELSHVAWGWFGQTFTVPAAGPGQEFALDAVTLLLVAGRPRHLAWSGRPSFVRLYKIEGRAFRLRFVEGFLPESESATDPDGDYLTVRFRARPRLVPGAAYAIEFSGAGGGDFWWDGSLGSFPGGSAYRLDGDKRVALPGDRALLLHLTLGAVRPMISPGVLGTAAQYSFAAARIKESGEPWKGTYDALCRNPFANAGRPPRFWEWIVRGVPGNNYTPTQQSFYAAWLCAMRWRLDGSRAHGDTAVNDLNAAARTIKGVTGNSNLALAGGIVGYLAALAADPLAGYDGWQPADRERYRDMLMNAFYQANFDFLWRRFDTVFREGRTSHYRLNWDTANIASMAAIGVVCDNRAVYEQALLHALDGEGNNNLRRAAWYDHPDGVAQTEEAGRDQGHNKGGWTFLAEFATLVGNQGTDLFAYDDCRILRGLEYNARYNLGNDVPYVQKRWESIVAPGVRGPGNGYAPVEAWFRATGRALPWCERMSAQSPHDDGPWPPCHPGCYDYFGFNTLLFNVSAAPAIPSCLVATRSGSSLALAWIGSRGATGYRVYSAPAREGPYRLIATNAATSVACVDTNPAPWYVVRALLPGSKSLDSEPLDASPRLVYSLPLDGSLASQPAPGRQSSLHGPASWTTDETGHKALVLNPAHRNYVVLPPDTFKGRDMTISVRVKWNGGRAFQRIFDFGGDIDVCAFLTPDDGSGRILFAATTDSFGATACRIFGPKLQPGRWTRLAVTIRERLATLYVDGQPVGTATLPSDLLFAQPVCWLGRSLFNPDPFFDGALSDLRVYNYALRPTDLRSGI